MKLRQVLMVAALAAATFGAAEAKAGVTAAQVHARTVVVDDPLEHHTVVSTERAVRSGRGVLNNSWNDNHLRAEIDKRTGAVRYEVRQALQYHGVHRDYRTVNYIGADGLVSAELTRLGDNREACIGPDTLGCFGREDVAFEVDEATLRRVAAGDVAADPAWAFKFKAGKGAEQRDGISRAEVAGLLAAVDSYRQRTVAQR